MNHFGFDKRMKEAGIAWRVAQGSEHSLFHVILYVGNEHVEAVRKIVYDTIPIIYKVEVMAEAIASA